MKHQCTVNLKKNHRIRNRICLSKYIFFCILFSEETKYRQEYGLQLNENIWFAPLCHLSGCLILFRIWIYRFEIEKTAIQTSPLCVNAEHYSSSREGQKLHWMFSTSITAPHPYQGKQQQWSCGASLPVNSKADRLFPGLDYPVVRF